jgi:cyclic pyranopterin phosphate synthase
MPEEGIELMEKSNIMSLEEIVSLSKTFIGLGVNTIRLTGGEPLVRKNVAFLLRELAATGVTLKLTTNGILLDQHFDLLREIGLTRLNISLDSLDKARALFMTKRDYYDRIMANVRQALDLGFSIKLNVVLIKDVNDREIPDFVRLTREQDLTVKFIEFMPFKGNQWDWSKGVSQESILQTVADTLGPVIPLPLPPHSTSVNFRVEGYRGSFGIVSTITQPFCGGCNRIRLTADGKMKNCLFATAETDLLTPLRQGQAIEPLILAAIQHKKFSRDGMELGMDKDHYEQNRAMISIGG